MLAFAMAIREMLLPLTSTTAAEAALVTALLAARQWQAHLLALHVHADRGDIAQLAAEGLTGAMIEEMMRAADAEGARRADAVRVLFDRFVSEHGIPVAPPEPGRRAATASFAMTKGRQEDRVACAARLADLTIVPRPDTTEDVSSSDALHAALFDSGRPVLIAPAAAPVSLGRHICLAWSGTAEAAAAVRAGIPWMQRAETVTLLTSRDYQRRGPSGEELAVYLAQHDIEVVPRAFAAGERGPGASLLASVQDAGADLLIMGAYSSSRLRQLILGGVTRHVLERAGLPVLMCR